MFDEIFGRLPEVIQSLLDKISQNPDESKEKEKLISNLRNINEELNRLSQMQGDKLTKEQVEEMLKIPRPMPNFNFLKKKK